MKKSNFKQRYKSIQGLRSFKDTLPTKVKRIITKKGEIYTKTFENWKYLVGEEFFKICYPKSYKKNNINNKYLTIMVQRGFEVDLDYSRQKIIDKINYFLGKNTVDKIKLITFDNNFDQSEIKKKNITNNKNYKIKLNNLNNLDLKKSLVELTKVYKEK